MDISDIAMLEAIVKHGSINKASEVLHVTQPTLSKRLGRLEYKLGTPLFLRNSSGLTPTDHTRFIIDSSQSIKTDVRNIERHIQLMNTLEEGELRIGVGPIVEQLYFPHVLKEITKSPTSKIGISVRTEAGEDLIHLLIEGEIDIAIGPFEEDDPSEKHVVFPVTSQALVYATRPDHPLARRALAEGPITRAEIHHYPLIAPHVPQYVADQAGDLPVAAASRIVCDNYQIIKDFLKESDHASSGPIAVFADSVRDGTLAIIAPRDPLQWRAACIARPETATLPMIKRVIDIFRGYELPSVELS